MRLMSIDEITAKLETAGLEVADVFRDPNNTGWRLRLTCAVLVCLYDSGKIILQGENTDLVRTALDSEARLAGDPVLRKVFVVYGEEGPARTELELMLRRWGLEPTNLTASSRSADAIQALESARRDALFGIVIATPDDEGYERGHSERKLFRTRQNVVLELGMMLAALGKSRVAILMKSGFEMEPPSEIEGLTYIPWKESITEARLKLAWQIHNQGIDIGLNDV
ncbi:MAG: TIR domain-containing protein [Hyphomicrobiales bacterium]